MVVSAERYFQLLMKPNSAGKKNLLQNSLAARPEKIFRALIWHRHSLEISFELRYHTEMSYYHLLLEKLENA